MLVGDIVSVRHELHWLPSPLPFHGAVQRDLHPARQTLNPQLNLPVEQADLVADLEEVGERVGDRFWGDSGGSGRGAGGRMSDGELYSAWIQKQENLAQTGRC